jgi:hypothetical protein
MILALQREMHFLSGQMAGHVADPHPRALRSCSPPRSLQENATVCVPENEFAFKLLVSREAAGAGVTKVQETHFFNSANFAGFRVG